MSVPIINILTSLIFVVIGTFNTGSLDIAIGDTYYVILHKHISFLIALLFALFAIIYWLTFKLKFKLLKTLSWSHYILTLSGFLFLSLTVSRINHPTPVYSDKTVFEEFDRINSAYDANYWITILFLIVLIAQLILIFNVVRGFQTKNKL